MTDALTQTRSILKNRTSSEILVILEQATGCMAELQGFKTEAERALRSNRG